MANFTPDQIWDNYLWLATVFRAVGSKYQTSAVFKWLKLVCKFIGILVWFCLFITYCCSKTTLSRRHPECSFIPKRREANTIATRVLGPKSLDTFLLLFTGSTLSSQWHLPLSPQNATACKMTSRECRFVVSDKKAESYFWYVNQLAFEYGTKSQVFRSFVFLIYCTTIWISD